MRINHHVVSLVSADGTILRGRFWKPETPPLAALCMVHGLGEHSGKYDEWARSFCRKGIIVYALDYRGHGESEGKRGHANNISELLDDIDAMIKRCKQNWDNLPVFLYGHSMGGTLALAMIESRRQSFQGAIVTSPWLKLVNPPGACTRYLGHCFNNLLGGLTFKTGLNPSQMTRLPSKIEAADNDPLMHGKISLRLFNEIEQCASKILSRGLVASIRTLLLHGENDPVTCFKATKQLELLNPALFKSKYYTGALHELHNEPVAEEVFFDIMFFIKNNVTCQPAIHEEVRV